MQNSGIRRMRSAGGRAQTTPLIVPDLISPSTLVLVPNAGKAAGRGGGEPRCAPRAAGCGGAVGRGPRGTGPVRHFTAASTHESLRAVHDSGDICWEQNR